MKFRIIEEDLYEGKLYHVELRQFLFWFNIADVLPTSVYCYNLKLKRGYDTLEDALDGVEAVKTYYRLKRAKDKHHKTRTIVASGKITKE